MLVFYTGVTNIINPSAAVCVINRKSGCMEELSHDEEKERIYLDSISNSLQCDIYSANVLLFFLLAA